MQQGSLNRPLCSLDKEVLRRGNTRRLSGKPEPLTKVHKCVPKESTAQFNFSNYSIALKGASYNFSGSIPPEFENKLPVHHHKQRFGKIATTITYYIQQYFSALGTVLPKPYTWKRNFLHIIQKGIRLVTIKLEICVSQNLAKLGKAHKMWGMGRRGSIVA